MTLVLGSLVFWLPILVVLAALVWFKMGTPIFFCQTRPGLRKKPFTLIKFRTMKFATNSDGEELPDSERLTTFGRWLRATSMDELPELLNILKGEMSLVGPRPLLMRYLDRFTPTQDRRHEVLPGLTGWSQVNGRNSIGWDEKLTQDVWYVENKSFLLDIKILTMTFKQILGRKGINAPGEATMPEFRPLLKSEAKAPSLRKD